MQLSENVRRQVLKFQQTEITEHHIYKRLSKRINSPENAKILKQIAEDEFRHYNGWKRYTNQDIEPRWFLVWFYYIVSLVFGFTFGVKLMEMGEVTAQGNYAAIRKEIPEAEKYEHDEDVHEEQLINMLDEERLQYAGSVVLGLNDALVELTGGCVARSPEGWTAVDLARGGRAVVGLRFSLSRLARPDRTCHTPPSTQPAPR